MNVLRILPQSPAYRSARLCMVLGALIPILLAMQPRSGFAENTAFQVLQTNPLTFDDGPSGTELICSCYTERDLIRVLRVEGDEDISPNLDSESDFDGTLWLFDVGMRGRFQIVVRFFRDDGALMAQLFQDQTDDKAVSIGGTDQHPTVTEPGTWSIQLTALDGYWQRDGRIAPNVDMLIDDRMYAMFGAEHYVETMLNDSAIDATITVRGPTASDPRSIDWRNATPPVPKSEGILRTTLMVRESGTEPAIVPIFPWLFLGYASDTSDDALLFPTEANKVAILESRESVDPAYTGFDHPYGGNAPPIQVDWALARTAGIGEVISSRWSDTNWFTYSINRIEPGTVTNPNFESPFGFYDLADDHDGIPELMVRIERLNANDPTIANQYWYDRNVQKIRYVWDQGNDQSWSFKLGMLGQYDIDQEVPFADFTLQTVPYDSLPGWVVDRSWDIVSFVASERPTWTTEGIYDWDPSGNVRDLYYAGASTWTGGTFDQINIGLRGDYRLDLDDQPWLTFNPIDARLHLLNAEAGIWQVDEARTIVYGTTNGSYFDSWTLTNDDDIEQQLYRVPGGLLYSDQFGTLFKQVDIPYESFRTLPPTTTEEWTALGEMLDANAFVSEPGDLRAYFDQFDGPVTVLANEQAIDVRKMESGAVTFSFPSAEGQSHGELAKLVGAPIQPGPVNITLSESGWSATAASYGSLDVSVGLSDVVADSLTEGTVHIKNTSTFAISNAYMTIQVTSPDGKTIDLSARDYSQPLTLAGGQEMTVPISWAPSSTEPRELSISIERETQGLHQSGPAIIGSYSEVITAKPAAPVPTAEAATLATQFTSVQRLLGLALVSLVCGMIGFVVLQSRGGSP